MPQTFFQKTNDDQTDSHNLCLDAFTPNDEFLYTQLSEVFSLSSLLLDHFISLERFFLYHLSIKIGRTDWEGLIHKLNAADNHL